MDEKDGFWKMVNIIGIFIILLLIWAILKYLINC